MKRLMSQYIMGAKQSHASSRRSILTGITNVAEVGHFAIKA